MNDKHKNITTQALRERNRAILDQMKRLLGEDKYALTALPLGGEVHYDAIQNPAHRLDWLAKFMIVRHEGDSNQEDNTQSVAEQTMVKPSMPAAQPAIQALPVLRYTPPGVIHKMPLAQ